MTGVEILWIVVGVIAFIAIGSFTCVVIDRLPLALDEPNQYGELWDTRPWPEVVGGSSRCSSCGAPVKPSDNIPVISWLALMGRCRSCGEPIPAFHPLVELGSGLLFLGAVWAFGLHDWRLLPALWLIPVGLAVSVIDIRTFIVPTRIVWPAFGVSVVLTAVAAGLSGDWGWLLSALVGLAVMAGPLFVVWFINPKGMGFGDVRLVTLLGWNVGFFAGGGLAAPAVLAVICLAIAAMVGLVVGIAALGARGRKAQVPFGPSLVVATYLCIALAPQILEPFGL
ncbi:MAG: prepilin peptidase [Microthrixaceae bacterium]